MTQHALGAAAQIPAGEGRTFQVGAHAIAVFRTRAGSVFATQATCPHRKGPLADGLLGHDTVVCPLHEWSFDLASGAPRAAHGERHDCALRVYPIEQRDDGTLVITLD